MSKIVGYKQQVGSSCGLTMLNLAHDIFQASAIQEKQVNYEFIESGITELSNECICCQ
jgi:hypothetical protein